MFTKSRLILIAAMMLVIPLVTGCGLSDQKSKTKQKITIGVVIPLTGGTSYGGERVKSGVDLAVEEINNSGGIGGKEMVAIYEDSQCDPKLAVVAARKLKDIDKVSVVLGDWCSGGALAMAPILEESEVVQLALGIAANLRDAGDYIFRAPLGVEYHAKAMADYLVNKAGVKKLAILYINNEFGVSWEEFLKNYYQKAGGGIVLAEPFEQGAADFRTSLAKLDHSNAEAVFMVAMNEYGPLLLQTKEMDIRQPRFAYATIEAQEILDVAGDAADGVIYTSPFDADSSSLDTQRYQEKYQAKYGKLSDYFAACSYDAAMLAARAMKVCGEDSSCIKEELYQVKNYPGASGTINVDDHGDFILPVIFKKIENGKFVFMKK